MTKNLTKVNLHSVLGDTFGREFNLAVKSVSECIRAINVLTNRQFNKFLFENDRVGLRYMIFINSKPFKNDEKLSLENLDKIQYSELVIKHDNLRTVDIVPVLEGAGNAGSIAAIIVGIILVVVGIILIETPLGPALILAGLGLIAAGVINLLSSPPHFDDFPEIGGARRSSFLFEGPQNTTRENLPVPVGYGELLVGSAVIAATYEITDVSNEPAAPDYSCAVVSILNDTPNFNGDYGRLPRSIQNSSYSTTLTATGGTGVYTWLFTKGDLPRGLSFKISNNSLIIKGTPTEPGDFHFSVRVHDANGAGCEKELKLVVMPLTVDARDLKSWVEDDWFGHQAWGVMGGAAAWDGYLHLTIWAPNGDQAFYLPSPLTGAGAPSQETVAISMRDGSGYDPDYDDYVGLEYSMFVNLVCTAQFRKSGDLANPAGIWTYFGGNVCIADPKPTRDVTITIV